MFEHTYAKKPKAISAPAVKPAPAAKTTASLVHHATNSGGGALDTKTQREMGSRFGHDFSQVRVHTDTRAAESVQSLGANAFAVGSDIVFGEGKYAPGSADGDRLLAHELTHVVQQAKYGAGREDASSRREDASEREADSLASQVMMGRSVQVQAMPGAAIARDPGESIWDRLKPGGSGILHGSEEGSWNPSAPAEEHGEYDEFGTKKPEKSYMEKWAGPDSWVGNNQNDPWYEKLGKGFLAAPVALGGYFADEITGGGPVGMMAESGEQNRYSSQYEANKESAQQTRDQEDRRRQEENPPAPFIPHSDEGL